MRQTQTEAELLDYHKLKNLQSETKREALGVRRLIRAQKSVVPAPSDRDPAGETSCDTVLQFNPSDFVKQTRGPIIRADLCCNLYFNPLLFCKTNPGS
jgi:hypothetical protein